MLTAMEHIERAEALLGHVQDNPKESKLINRARLHVEMAQYKKMWVEVDPPRTFDAGR